MPRLLVVPLAALLNASCILEDPYAIKETTSLESGTGPKDDAPSAATEPDEPSPSESEPDVVSPAPEPAPVTLPRPPEPEDDILVPAEPAPNPEVGTPEPADVVEPAPSEIEPAPEPGTLPDDDVPEPVDTPEPSPDADAGAATCSPSDCATVSGCGNGVVEARETCDGEDLAGESCHGQGFSGGTLSCTAGCELDTTDCVTGASCEGVTSASTGLVYEGNLNGQGNDVRNHSCSLGGRTSADVSVSWTAPSSGCFEISVDSTAAIDTVIGVYADCRLDDELGCDDEYGDVAPESILEFEAVANTSYAIVVDAYEPGDQAAIEVTISECLDSEWTCIASRYADGASCDCGCGILDPDCADSSADSCDTCDEQGSCGESQCWSIAAEENWNCGPSGPFGR